MIGARAGTMFSVGLISFFYDDSRCRLQGLANVVRLALGAAHRIDFDCAHLTPVCATGLCCTH